MSSASEALQKALYAALSGDAALTAAITGNRVELRAGCDKTFATCRARFGNAVNFRGEPHVPGTDSVTAYPGL